MTFIMQIFHILIISELLNWRDGTRAFLKSYVFLVVAPVAERLRALFLNHLTTVSGAGSSAALATCETSQVLPGGFFRGSPVFAHLLIGPSHMS